LRATLHVALPECTNTVVVQLRVYTRYIEINCPGNESPKPHCVLLKFMAHDITVTDCVMCCV